MLVSHAVVRIDLQLGLVGLAGDHRDLRPQAQLVDRRIVPVQRARLIDLQADRIQRVVRLNHVRVRLRKVDLHFVRQDGSRDHEDDQEHQHHVDKRRDVDIRHRSLAASTTECHDSYSLPVVMKPTWTMPCSLALPRTLRMILYSVVLSARICSSGCGDFDAATANWALSSASVTSLSLTYMT